MEKRPIWSEYAIESVQDLLGVCIDAINGMAKSIPEKYLEVPF